ncbi:hypothetical protein B4135_1532 [Caldibacillus debilis]|uniref:Uncharacterized protein n=1 Tax=Caldibacillus debilis TaxID=301148 RepID=A0A150MBR9_9BACI|nr:hypothetical protein B4135_1532 [Caldibacillus debilis]
MNENAGTFFKNEIKEKKRTYPGIRIVLFCFIIDMGLI